MKFTQIILCVLGLCVPSVFGLTPNLPAGTVTSGLVVNTRFGAMPDAIRYAPKPVLPREVQRLSGHGVYIVDIAIVRGFADDVRVLQSSGSKILDDVAIEALSKWRFKPRSVYKVTVPIDFGTSGRIKIGS